MSRQAARRRAARRIETHTGYNAAQLADLIQSSYDDQTSIPGFSVDKELSDKRVKVYRDDKSGKAVAVHRGSANVEDWRDNLKLITQGKFASTDTYKKHAARQERIDNKYGSENVTLIGHSRAGGYVEHLNRKRKYDQVITYNKAANWSHIGQRNPSNQTDIRSNYDLVSALRPFQTGGNNVYLHDQIGPNLIQKHSTTPLRRLPLTQEGVRVPPTKSKKGVYKAVGKGFYKVGKVGKQVLKEAKREVRATAPILLGAAGAGLGAAVATATLNPALEVEGGVIGGALGERLGKRLVKNLR